MTRRSQYAAMSIHQQWEAAKDPDTAAEDLAAIVEAARDRRVIISVAEHPNTPVEVLERLADAEARDVRAAVASNPRTPKHLTLELAEDYATEVAAAAVASGQLTALEIKTIWQARKNTGGAGDKVEEALAATNNPEILAYLWDSEHPQIRELVASNQATPLEALVALACDYSSDAADIVAERAEHTGHPALQLAVTLAEDQKTQPSELVAAVKTQVEADYSQPVT